MRSFPRLALLACSLVANACSSRPDTAPTWPPPGQWMGPPSAPAPALVQPLQQDQTQAVGRTPSAPPEPYIAPDPRCPKFGHVAGGSLDTLRRSVAACVGYRRYFDDPKAISDLLRAIGTRVGEREDVKCAGGFPEIVLFDAKGDTTRLIFCAQTADRQALLGLGPTIHLADGAALKAWLRDRDIPVSD